MSYLLGSIFHNFDDILRSRRIDENFHLEFNVDEERISLMNNEENRASLVSLPYFLNPYNISNAAIFLSYFNVGIAIYLLTAPLSYYLINTLNVSSAEYNAYVTLITLPWSLKFIFGSISDCNRIFGYRRKSWMLIGWVIFIFISLILSSSDQPNLALITTLSFTMTCAYLLSDVCNDAQCVERARYETEEIKGSLQSSAYTIRAFGSIIGASLGALLYNTPTWGWGLTISQMFTLSALIPMLTLFPFIWFLIELPVVGLVPTFTETYQKLWDTLQLEAVWYPMIFIYTYAVFQIPNAAWTNFLVQGLEFTDFDLGLLTIAGATLYFGGMMTFQTFFFDSSWRNIYLFTGILNFIFSIGQVLLILRWNKYLGIPDIIFALGDNGMEQFMWAINSMPACIMYLMLCPEGSEGITYALLTTISNLAGAVAYDFGTLLTYIWDVNNSTIEAGDYSGILKLTILTSFLQLSPLILLKILPDSRAEQRKLRDSGRKSFIGGFILATVIAASLLFTFIFNFVLIWK